MIKLDIGTRNYEANPKIRAYIQDKIGNLDKYLPRQVRESASGTVLLEEDVSGREDNRLVCEVIITVHGQTLMSKEGTLNMYAAIDIVEAKLKAQVRTFKEKYALRPRRERMLSRWMRRDSETAETRSEVPENAIEPGL